jgi:hypothetical protein
MLLILALSIAGCMQTRRVEVCSASTCDGTAASSNTSVSERRWFGIWPGQPARIQP